MINIIINKINKMTSSNTLKHVNQKVSLIDFMGSDQTVANAARVSFGKHKEAASYELLNLNGNIRTIRIVDDSDKKLIKFLAKENHWSPFGHVTIQFRIKAPFFVARQLGKHQVGLVWNEISRRYVDYEPEFYLPKEWRKRAPNKKQGSLEDVIIYEDIEEITKNTLSKYNELIKNDIAPEMARMVLPLNTHTEWYWTGTLYAFARVCNLRLKPDAQKETREVANMISEECKRIFPESWKCLMSSYNDLEKDINDNKDYGQKKPSSSNCSDEKRQKVQ